MLNFSKKLVMTSVLIFTTCSASSYAMYIPEQLEQFEKTGECVNCDLSGAYLSGHSHNSSNLSGALLVKASLSNTEFYTSKFNGAELMYASFNYTRASGSQFVSANLTGATLVGTNLSSTDFQGAVVTDANFENAILARSNITKEQLASAKSLSCAIMPDGTRHESDSGSPCF